MTVYAEVIGDPIAHSKSPIIHRYWLEKLGMEGDYRAVRVSADGLEAYLRERRADPDWRGCNVTMPLKQAVIPLLDGLLVEARVTRAVNVVVKVEDILAGSNTDMRGFAEPFREHFPERGKAALIGAGGAASAAFVALAALGFEIVHVANRTPAKADEMLRSLGQKGRPAYSLDDPLPAVDLLVNASALGTGGAGPVVDLSALPPSAIVYDIVYEPLETGLLAAARRRGLRTIDGLAMLIGQAAASFVHFFDGQPPREHDAELRELLAR